MNKKTKTKISGIHIFICFDSFVYHVPNFVLPPDLETSDDGNKYTFGYTVLLFGLLLERSAVDNLFSSDSKIIWKRTFPCSVAILNASVKLVTWLSFSFLPCPYKDLPPDLLKMLFT